MRTRTLRTFTLLLTLASACCLEANPAAACPGETALACLKIEDAARRERWVKAMRDDGGQAATYVTAFLGLVGHSDPVIGDRAVEALLGMAPRSAPALAAVVREGDFPRTIHILQALMPVTEAWKVDVCVAAFHDPAEHVRRLALLTLAPTKNPRAVPGIIALLKDPSVRIRAQAARSLGYFDDRRAFMPLVGSLRDPDAAVRRAAGRSLEAITGAHHGENRAAWLRWRGSAK